MPDPFDSPRRTTDGGPSTGPLLLPKPRLSPLPSSVAGDVDAARRGVSSAWTAIFRRYNRLVVATARRYGLNLAECEDTAQTTWLSLYQHIDQLRDDAALAGWLVTTAAREAQRSARRRTRETPTESIQDQAEVDSPDVVDLLTRRASVEAMRRCIGRLPKREREVVESLLDPQTLSYQQIGTRLGMPIGSIGPIRQRALRRLHALLTDEAAAS